MHDSAFLASCHTSVVSHSEISFWSRVGLSTSGFLCCSAEATELSSKLKEKLAGWGFLRSGRSACCISWVSERIFKGNFHVM